jgi:hypothetical protein
MTSGLGCRLTEKHFKTYRRPAMLRLDAVS